MGEPASDESVGVPSEVLAQRLPDDEMVLLDLVSEQYFGLDATATVMWDALTGSGHVAQAFDELRERFDVDPEVLRHDLDTFVRQLAARGLLRVGGDAS